MNSTIIPRIVKFFNKYMYKIGLGASMNRYDNSLTFYSSFKDKKLYKNYSINDAFCNFGSGAFNHCRWTNFDFPGATKYYKAIQGIEGSDFQSIDLCIDNLRLPLNNESVNLIYCSHTLEHLEEDKAIHFLSECLRILKSEGVMRIVVPSTDKDFVHAKITNQNINLNQQVKTSAILSAANHVLDVKNIDEVEIIKDVIDSEFSPKKFYKKSIERGANNKFDSKAPERHITYWDQEKFYTIAKELGFANYLPLYRGSTVADPFRNLEVFDNTETQHSLYGEFIKL